MLRKRKKRNNKNKAAFSVFYRESGEKKELSMRRYEEIKMSIVVFESDDIIRMSFGDNEVPEFGAGDEGGIFE